MCHTRLDKNFCDMFDMACARVGIKSFRSEFETIPPPAWKTIRDQMNRSSAMFLLIGSELVKMQESSSRDPKTARSWKYTQNWIAYEIGLACQRGIDIWVLCDNASVNFPVPYFNHYQPFAGDMTWLRQVLDSYNRMRSPPHGSELEWTCPDSSCGIKYVFWGYHHTRPFEVPCPQCLRIMKFG
jgi:hypothetical protein